MEDQQTNHPEPSVKTVLAALLLFLPIAAHAQTSVIYDDDCASDNDCGINFATLHQLANEDSIRILATITDSANPLAAPAMKIFNTYNGRPDLLVASNHANTPANPICDKRHCNASSWLPTLIQHYAPTDTAANYPDCLPVYRSTLAAQPDHSVTLISTGFLTCIARLLASPPDKLSPLTGADLIKKKVTKLTVMGGAYPSGSEFNLDADPEDSATVFTTWTTPHGFPPIYLISFADGANVLSGPPPGVPPDINPVRLAFDAAKSTQRGSWDSMTILYAARGLSFGAVTYWTDSGDGTLTIDRTTGADTFSTTTPSGHHYLINALSDQAFSHIFDGYNYTGFAALPPGHRK